jgi:hypothetical protein
MDMNVDFTEQQTAVVVSSALQELNIGINPALLTQTSPMSSPLSTGPSSTTSSDDESSRPATAIEAVSHVFQDSSDEEDQLQIPKRKPKATPRIRVVESSEDEAPSQKRKRVTRSRPKQARAPDLPVPTIETVREEMIPAIKVVKPDRCSREGILVKLHKATPEQDPLQYEFRVSERTVNFIVHRYFHGAAF